MTTTAPVAPAPVYTYEIYIPGGYNIYKDGVLYIIQDFDPNTPDWDPYTDADKAEADAKAQIAVMTHVDAVNAATASEA